MQDQIRNAFIMLLVSIVLILTADKFYIKEVNTETIADVNNSNKIDLYAEEIDRVASAEYDKLKSEYENLGIVVCSGFVNLRKSPSLDGDYNVTASLYDMTPCTILTEYENDYNWYQVKVGDNTGYVLQDYIVTGSKAKNELYKAYTLVLKNTASVEEYYKPTMDIADNSDRSYTNSDVQTEHLVTPIVNTASSNNVTSIIADGSEIKVIDLNNEWYMLKDGSGFIKKDSPVEVASSLYGNVAPSKKKESFLDEYTNFGVSQSSGLVEIKETSNRNSKTIGILPNNSGVELLESGENWYKIASGKINGYVFDCDFITGDEAVEYGYKNSRLRLFTGDTEQRVYSEKSLLSNNWTKLGKNQAYDVEEIDGYWVKISLDSGDITEETDSAYVNIEDNTSQIKYSLNTAIAYLNMLGNTEAPKDVTSTSNADLRLQIIDYACQFIGNPYVWGGTSLTNGADCSGFVQSVLKHFGIYIPRVSRDQAKVGIPINSPDELRPGDLIFYANSSGTVNHVAMYIGNGMIVNAGSAKSGILINTYDYRTPVAMRNVIGNRER